MNGKDNRAMKKHKGFIAWQGASELDGQPIALVFVRGSHNRKTGGVVQTYILRSDVSPTAALKSGADASICGDCKHRPTVSGGLGSCYVRVENGPLIVFKTMQRGKYPTLTLEEASAQIAGENIRLGAYGDPAAVPTHVWHSLLAGAKDWTGYTHQWKHADGLKPFCMASCDTAEEYNQARANGWRAFYVVPKGFAGKVADAFLCPASEEAGKKLTCVECMACNGTHTGRKASVFIPVHGVAFKQTRFNNLIQIGRN
jgi:hypothetical protein